MRGLERVKHGKSATADNWSLNDISQQHREHLFGFRQNRISSVSFIVEILTPFEIAWLASQIEPAMPPRQSSPSSGHIIRMTLISRRSPP